MKASPTLQGDGGDDGRASRSYLDLDHLFFFPFFSEVELNGGAGISTGDVAWQRLGLVNMSKGGVTDLGDALGAGRVGVANMERSLTGTCDSSTYMEMSTKD